MFFWQNFGTFFVHSMYFIASLYLYTWFIRLLQPRRRLRHTIRLIFLILVGSLFIGKILGRYEFNSIIYFLSFVSSIWMGFTFFFCVFAGGSDLIRYLLKKFPLPGLVTITNSRVSGRTLVAVISGLVFVTGG